MLNIPETVKALYKRDGVNKNFRAHFLSNELPDITNENIVQESVKFQESVCSQDVFKFGLTEASVIEFETVGVANMYGMTIQCFNEIDCSSLSAAEIADIEAGTWDGTWDGTNKVFAVPYGVFRVESCPRDHQAMAHRKVTAYTADFVGDGELFRGQVAVPRMTFYPEDMLKAIQLKPADMVAKDSADAWAQYWLCYHDKVSASGSGISVLMFYGIAAEYNIVFDYANTSAPILDFTHKKVFLRFDFQPHEFDSYSNDMFNAAVSVMPAANNIYEPERPQSGTNYQVFANRQQMFAAESGRFAPCFYLYVWYYNPSAGKMRVKVSMPVIVESGETYVVNTRDLSGFKFGKDLPTGFNQICGIQVRACVPWAWKKTARWESTAGNADVTNWPIADKFPEGVEWIYRNADEKPSLVYVYETTEEGTGIGATIENTLDFNLSRLGKYYTYSNAASKRELINGYLELTAQYAQASRDGTLGVKMLSNSFPLAIAPGGYSQMWWDEYDVAPIGTVRYAYTDEAGEEQIVDYKFGDGASVYDMTDNAVLKAMSGASPDVIESLLDTYFVPHLASVNFVPIDLAAKGLPYIEAGDALSVTAQDGTVCNSYALRQEIDGIQSLTAQIDSESGLILDSEEGD